MIDSKKMNNFNRVFRREQKKLEKENKAKGDDFKKRKD
jgi:hypothetical protein